MYKIEKTYPLLELIDRFDNKYTNITGYVGGKSKTVIKYPEVQMLNKKMYIQNFKDVCMSMNRELSDCSNYISKELQIQTSISSNNTLIIHGTYKKNVIENIIKKYVVNYVQCPLCKTQDTKLEKIDRITFILCNRCHAKNAI